jgi:hypothetical protein
VHRSVDLVFYFNSFFFDLQIRKMKISIFLLCLLVSCQLCFAQSYDDLGSDSDLGEVSYPSDRLDLEGGNSGYRRGGYGAGALNRDNYVYRKLSREGNHLNRKLGNSYQHKKRPHQKKYSKRQHKKYSNNHKGYRPHPKKRNNFQRDRLYDYEQ